MGVNRDLDPSAEQISGKSLLQNFIDFDEKAVQSILREMLARDAICHLCIPLVM